MSYIQLWSNQIQITVKKERILTLVKLAALNQVKWMSLRRGWLRYDESEIYEETKKEESSFLFLLPLYKSAET